MLQKLREKTTGWLAFVILGLLTVPFLFFGVENYFTQQVPTWVAKVGDKEISPEEFRQRFDRHRAQMRQVMGEAFDARSFETPEAKRRVLEQMVEEKLLEQAAEQRGVVVPNSQLQQQILEIEAFKVNGRFDQQRYSMLLASQNMSPRQFEQQLRSDLEVQFLPRQVVGTGFVTDAYLDRYLALRDQTRDIAWVPLAPPSADSVGAVDDAALQAFYDANRERFMSPEQVSIEYVQLSPEGIEVPVEVDEATLRQRYDEQRTRFVEPEARLSSHILVSVPANADADAVQAAREEAAAIAASARAEGADFAALAREHSDDLGSKAGGGDLGWIEKGLLDPAFEDALFALEPGAISDPVKTSEGWHVIQLREVREEQGQSFEQAREQLQGEYLEGERERRYSDVAGQLVDLVYRDPTTLSTAAAELGLDIQTAGPFGRNGGQGIAANPEVVRAAFSEEVLAGNVSDPIELDDGSMVLVRATRHQPAAPRPLEEVKEAVRTAAMSERIAVAAREAAEQALTQARSGASLEQVATDHGSSVERAEDVGRNAASVEAGVLREAFDLPAPQDGQSTLGLAELGGDRYAVIAVQGVTPGDPAAVDPAARTALREQLGRAIAGVEARALVDALRAQADVQVAEERM